MIMISFDDTRETEGRKMLQGEEGGEILLPSRSTFTIPFTPIEHTKVVLL